MGKFIRDEIKSIDDATKAVQKDGFGTFNYILMILTLILFPIMVLYGKGVIKPIGALLFFLGGIYTIIVSANHLKKRDKEKS